MSSALLERAGIPLVARHLAWNLSRAPDITASALISSIHENSQAGRYHRQKPNNEALREDAEYLADVLGIHHGGIGPALWLRQFLRVLTGASFPLIPFERGHFEEIFWEKFFSPGLPSSCRDLLDRLQFFRTPLTRREITFREIRKIALPRLDTTGIDFVIFQNPSFIRVSPGTIKIIRCHDLIPLFRFDTQPLGPHAISDFHQGLVACAKDSHFVCVSESTRDELLSFKPELEARSSVIPNSLLRTEAIQPRSLGATKSYFLAVGTIEPRKNYSRLLDAFRIYRRIALDPLPLVLVANPGWQSEGEMREIEMGVREGWVTWLKDVSPERLKYLYADAHALISASVHEGFGYPALEAANQGTPAVLSDLKIYRSHFGDAAEYFEPYDPTSLAQALIRMDAARRNQLAAQARDIAQRFHADIELERWRELFGRLKGSKA